jgi:hypothetical protein
MNKELMTIVLESFAFWELAGDELVDPDAAAEQIDGAVDCLNRLTPGEKAEFAAFARTHAEAEQAAKGPPERVDLFRDLAEKFSG